LSKPCATKIPARIFTVWGYGHWPPTLFFPWLMLVDCPQSFGGERAM
jgi:hypothetical protein